jgi:dienelactone hydrolase
LAYIILFHSILGLRPAEREIASVLEGDGHTVILPDLFDGRSTNDYDAGFALMKEVGEESIHARAKAAVIESPEDVVLSGISFGAFRIRQFWEIRPNMAGALLFSGATPWMTPPRSDFPVSAHIARPDPFDDEDYFAEWAADAGDVALELHRYDDVGHYFLDRTLPDYNAAAAALCLERSREFLRNL